MSIRVHHGIIPFMKINSLQIRNSLLIALVFSLILAMPVFAGGEAEQTGLTSFKTMDIYGNEATQQIFATNAITLVNVWGTFCPPCLEEMPALGELAREYASKGVGIVGIVADVVPNPSGIGMINLDTAIQIAAQTKAEYPHLIISEDLQKTRLGNVQAVPETFFVDSKGKVIGQTVVGARSKAAWKILIEKHLSAVQK